MNRCHFPVSVVLLGLTGASSLAQSTQVTIPASPIFQPSDSFYELQAADVDTGEWGRVFIEWQTPRGMVRLGPEDGLAFIDGLRRTDIDDTALLACVYLPQRGGFPCTQFLAGGGPVNGVSCRVGAQADLLGGPLIDSVITMTFDDGFAYSFPVSAAGLTYVGFYRPDGPEIHSVTFTASVGVTAINTFGIGTVPGPGSAGLLVLGGLLTVSRRRR